ITQAVEMPEGWAAPQLPTDLTATRRMVAPPTTPHVMDFGLAKPGDTNLLDQIIARTKCEGDSERERNRTYIDAFLRKAAQPGQVISKDVETNIKHWIAEIDEKVSAQLAEVMHHPDFQRLEATWRGLHYLVHQTETGSTLKIRVLNVSKRELFRDF